MEYQASGNQCYSKNVQSDHFLRGYMLPVFFAHRRRKEIKSGMSQHQEMENWGADGGTVWRRCPPPHWGGVCGRACPSSENF